MNNSINYAGYQYDKETGLYYLNARYYDPQIARFLSEDTYRGKANDPLSLNLYTYCSNNPITYSDPTGHWQKGDSNLPTVIQLAIMQLTDDWNNAKTDEQRQAIIKESQQVRKFEEKNGMIVSDSKRVNQIQDDFIPKERDDLRADDAERIYVDSQRAIGKRLLQSLNVVNKDLESKAFSDGIITPDEWRRMRNVDHNYRYVRGTAAPEWTDKLNVNEWASKSNLLKNGSDLQEAVDTAVAGVRDIANDSFMFPEAKRLLNHYLDNTGGIEEIDFRAMSDASQNLKLNKQKAIDEFISASNDLAIEGETVNIVSLRERNLQNNDDNIEWQCAVGSYETWGSGSVTMTNGKIQASFSYNMRDIYDFHEYKGGNQKVFLGIVDNGGLDNLNKLGVAKEFRVVGYDNMNITWDAQGKPVIVER